MLTDKDLFLLAVRREGMQEHSWMGCPRMARPWMDIFLSSFKKKFNRQSVKDGKNDLKHAPTINSSECKSHYLREHQ